MEENGGQTMAAGTGEEGGNDGSLVREREREREREKREREKREEEESLHWLSLPTSHANSFGASWPVSNKVSMFSLSLSLLDDSSVSSTLCSLARI
jgi:hypothetical protein